MGALGCEKQSTVLRLQHVVWWNVRRMAGPARCLSLYIVRGAVHEKRRERMRMERGIVALLIMLALSSPAVVLAQTKRAPEVKSPAAKRDNAIKKVPGRTELKEAEATMTLEDLVQTALEQNPSIHAAKKAVEAKEARIRPEGTLADPVFSFQTMGDLIPPQLQEGDPSSGRTFSLEQEIPFPGKLGLKSKMASKEAEAQSWDYEQTRRQVVADLKKAYYDYFFIHKSIAIVKEDKELLRSFEEIAQAKYRVGQSTQQDVFKAQVEISKLIDRLTVLDQRLEIARALINNLLYREPGTPLAAPAEFEKASLARSLDELYQLALANAPNINKQQREIERSEYGVNLARLEHYPDFAVGFSYVDRGDQPEMYGLMFKAKLPVYFWRKQGPELSGARSQLAGARMEKDGMASTLYYNVKDAYTLATTAGQLAQLYQKALIPQSSLSLEAAIASYQVGTVDFLTLVDSVVTLLEYQIKYYESLTDFQKALAQLEPFVGIELTRQ
jgi:outer membrane protein, heavy metal efflux system